MTLDLKLCAELLELDGKRTPGEWEPGWNTRYFGSKGISMCGRGPDSPVLNQDHPKFRELVSEPAMRDAAFIAAAPKLAEQLKAALGERKWLRTLLADALQTMKGVNAANEDQANPARKCSLLLLSCIRDVLSETEATR